MPLQNFSDSENRVIVVSVRDTVDSSAISKQLLEDPEVVFVFCTRGLWGMYKRSEPMGRLHSVQKHMANVYLPLQFKEVEMFREHTM